jgi:hypothetical protein
LERRPLAIVQAGQSYRVLVPVPTSPQRPLIIQYDCALHQIHPECKPPDQYDAYLDPTFGILRANYLFPHRGSFSASLGVAGDYALGDQSRLAPCAGISTAQH